MVNKTLPIAEALYPGYSLLFLFDNATGHLIYVKNVLGKRNMNKEIGRKQTLLLNKWYYEDGVRKIQQMNFQDTDGIWIQKKVKRVLENQNLWSANELNLSYLKPHCFNNRIAADYQSCVKSHMCDFCKVLKQHIFLICSKTQR